MSPQLRDIRCPPDDIDVVFQDTIERSCQTGQELISYRMGRVETCPAVENNHALVCDNLIFADVTAFQSGVTSRKLRAHPYWNFFKARKLLRFFDDILIIVQLNKERDRTNYMKLWNGNRAERPVNFSICAPFAARCFKTLSSVKTTLGWRNQIRADCILTYSCRGQRFSPTMAVKTKTAKAPLGRRPSSRTTAKKSEPTGPLFLNALKLL